MSSNQQAAEITCLFVLQYLPVHTGSSPDQVPFAWHNRDSVPLTAKGKVHSYVAVDPNVVPALKSTRPLSGSVKSPQSTTV